jgi:hypothetical protein
MGKEVFPQDKDYILDILDDVFFYIKQGSNNSLMQKPNSADRIFPTTNFLLYSSLSSFRASKVWRKICRGYFVGYSGQIQKIL